MWASLWARLLSNLFGDGVGADVAARATMYLLHEARSAVDREPEPVTQVRLRPGETYTVIARPPAGRRERKLAGEQRRLRHRDRSRPTRRQLRSAQRLRKAQRRLDRRRPGTRRHRHAAAAEEAAGRRFDRVMRPTRRQSAVHAALEETTAQLDAVRAAGMERARGQSRRRPEARVHD